MLTFKDLLYEVDFDDVWTILIGVYPDQIDLKNEYKKVFGTLLSLQAVEYIDLKIVLECIDSEYFSLYAVDLKDKKSKVSYSISDVPWKYWLSMSIDRKSLKLYGKEKIVAHCLWEMTYYGFDQEAIENTMKGFKSIVSNALKELKDEQNEKPNYFEDVNDKDGVISATYYFKINKPKDK